MKMKRKAILGTLALVMALSMAIPFAGVALAETERTSDIASDVRLALDIRAPAGAVVGQPVVMQVVEKHTGRVVAGAGIWAIDLNSVTVAADSAEAYAVLAEKSGQFLGQTNQRGLLRHSFDDVGRYVLVAVKSGFVPGFGYLGSFAVTGAELACEIFNLTVQFCDYRFCGAFSDLWKGDKEFCIFGLNLICSSSGHSFMLTRSFFHNRPLRLAG